MTKDDIRRMAREAELGIIDGDVWVSDGFITQELERFAALVEKHAIAASMPAIKLAMAEERKNGAAEEREACVKVCEELRPSNRDYDKRYYDACTDCAEVIRGRSNHAQG